MRLPVIFSEGFKAKCSPAIRVTEIYDSPTLRQNQGPWYKDPGIAPNLSTGQ